MFDYLLRCISSLQEEFEIQRQLRITNERVVSSTWIAITESSYKDPFTGHSRYWIAREKNPRAMRISTHPNDDSVSTSCQSYPSLSTSCLAPSNLLLALIPSTTSIMQRRCQMDSIKQEST
ncbi:hypothetical protein ASPCAL08895 [Aspergillus calidoustus]|uniref:Uncharacterized protein n=1 Tax=Aspergillus calidoustus TaxID=454130 RepID=A0A0U5GV25_ASPCI|nr:hypothetical protein ASPCAL08895 [Aspergillus calidoustus]